MKETSHALRIRSVARRQSAAGKLCARKASASTATASSGAAAGQVKDGQHTDPFMAHHYSMGSAPSLPEGRKGRLHYTEGNAGEYYIRFGIKDIEFKLVFY